MPLPEHALRLAFIAPGNSIHTRRWLEYFAERGHVVGLLSYGRLEERIEGVDLLGELTAFSSAAHRAGLRDLAAAVHRTRRVVRAFSPDIVHSHFVTGPGWLGAMSGARPFVVSAWGSDVLVDARRAPVRVLHRQTLRRAAYVLYDAEVVADRLAELGASPQQLRRALWGVDVDLFSPGSATAEQRAAFGLPQEGFVVLSIRGLRDLQNPLVVLRAFAAMLRDWPDAILALKLGPADDGLAPAVEAEISRLDLSSSVTVIGHMPHERLAGLYRAADLCLSVPSSDGTSVALLEAMATGRPVVVSDIPANREWITEGKSGMLVRPGDDAALAAALVRLAGSPDLRTTYGEAAREEVEARGSYDVQMRDVEALYRTAVDEHARA